MQKKTRKCCKTTSIVAVGIDGIVKRIVTYIFTEILVVKYI